VSRVLGWAALLLLLAGCASVGAPTPDELRNGTIHGIAETPITLRDGAYEGEPFQPGGASRLRVTLWDQPIAVADLDGRPGEEVAAILSASTGGSGSLVYVAVFGRRDDGRLAPAATALVGDRIKVHAMSIAERQVTLDIVEAGPGDPACCPSRLARKSYALHGAALVPVASTAGGNVSLAELAGTEWMLSSLDDRPVPAGARPPTLLFGDARVSGFGGCNRYTGTVGSRRVGTLSVGALATTKMACAVPAMDVEDRYLAALATVSQCAFVAGRLQLSGTLDGTSRTLTFERAGPK
jgi:heat shock protein HslJ